MIPESMPIADRFALSYKEAAEYTGVSITTLRRAVDNGYVVRSVPPGQTKPVVLRESLDEWVRAGLERASVPRRSNS